MSCVECSHKDSIYKHSLKIKWYSASRGRTNNVYSAKVRLDWRLKLALAFTLLYFVASPGTRTPPHIISDLPNTSSRHLFLFLLNILQNHRFSQLHSALEHTYVLVKEPTTGRPPGPSDRADERSYK